MGLSFWTEPELKLERSEVLNYGRQLYDLTCI